MYNQNSTRIILDTLNKSESFDDESIKQIAIQICNIYFSYIFPPNSKGIYMGSELEQELEQE